MKTSFVICRNSTNFGALVVLATLLAITPHAFATNRLWLGTTSDWDTAGNWNASGVPASGDVVYFNAQTANENVTFSAGSNPLFSLVFTGAGYGYTLGDPLSANGLKLADFRPIIIQSSLAANNTTETIAAPIEAVGRLNLGNFSPETAAGLAVRGVSGYGNTLILSGNITMDAASTIFIYGPGDILISGSIIGNGSAQPLIDTLGTVTFSGNNTYGSNSTFAGNVVLDYTTNNTSKIGAGATLILGNTGNGAHVVVKGNASSATTQLNGATAMRLGASSVEVDGNAGAIATLQMKAIAQMSTGTLVDFNTNAYGVITATNGNAGSGASATNIIGPWATFAQTYWATMSAGTIVGLTTDNGSVFNNRFGNYTVTSGGQTLNAASLGASEGANTVRFTSGGTLDLGGGTLTMAYAGIMVASGVTGDTKISNGLIAAQNSNGFGFDIYNYGTGTLTIAASLVPGDNLGIAKAGQGTVVFAGDNSPVFGQQIDILSGKLIMGNANALGASTYVGAPAYGIGNNIVLGDGTAILDLNGYNLYASNLNSDANFLPGSQAAAAGLNSQIINSKAGTVSTIRVAGTTSTVVTGGTAAQSTEVSGGNTLGSFYGGLNEAPGAILAIDIEKGTATGQVQLGLDSPNPIGDVSGGNGTAASGLQGAFDYFTGAITVGAGANLAFDGYAGYETTGVLTLNGVMGQRSAQGGAFAVGYLTGAGSFLSNQGFTLWVDTRGTVTDTFDGVFSGGNIAGAFSTLQVQGTGSLTLSHNGAFSQFWNYGTGTVTLVANTNTNANVGTLILQGESTTVLTGTSGVVGGNGFYSTGGKLIIAPSGSGANISVSSTATGFADIDGTAELVLDRGSNTSLIYTMGTTAQTRVNPGSSIDLRTTSTFTIGSASQDPVFVLGSAQGLAALGTSDKFLITVSQTVADINGNSIANPVPVVNLFDGLWIPYSTSASGAFNGASNGAASYAQNATPGSALDATFLTYSGTGAATDAGFMAYGFTSANTNKITTSGGNSVELINAAQTLSANTSVFALEVDKGGSLNLNGKFLTVGAANPVSGHVSVGMIILNGATLSGGTVQFSQNTHIYTDLDNGTISNISAANLDLAKDGPGTLFVSSATSLKNIFINQGALDLGALNSSVGTYYLHGGVIQGNGTITRQLSTAVGGVVFNTGNDFNNSLGGGFSARGGSLDVTLTDPTGSTNLIWGSVPFIQEGGVLNFGSLTSDNEVFFESNMDFGGTGNGNGIYSRIISVTANANDTGDPLAYADFTVLGGVLSNNYSPYIGFTKTGTGLLVLAGFNTYTGATTIAQGTLVILDDSGLGAAPTAAYGLNASPGISGNAITPGAIEINGGAALGTGLVGTDAAINSNRQILLASGTTGATAAIINVAGGSNFGTYTTLSFGGIIADYINEKGSLEKQGGGTLDYSGTAYNTGTFGVTAGTFLVSDSGSVNSASGITINNKSTDPAATAQFNYASTVGLSKAVTFGAGGGVFAYNSATAYTGANSLTITTKQMVAGSGNLGTLALTVGSGGTLMPGNVSGQTGTTTVGTLKVGAVTLLSGGNYNFLIADVSGAFNSLSGAGVGYSTINATSVDLSTLTTPFNLNLETLAGNVPGAPANFNPAWDYDFVLFATGTPGSITPENVASLDALILIHPEANNGATGFDPAPDHWYVYESADDSELILHYSAVPEPATWAMLLGGLGLLVFIRRLRSRAV